MGLVPSILLTSIIYFQSAIIKALNPNIRTKKEALIGIGIMVITVIVTVATLYLILLFFA
jgi:hypothetical protein